MNSQQSPAWWSHPDHDVADHSSMSGKAQSSGKQNAGNKNAGNKFVALALIAGLVGGFGGSQLAGRSDSNSTPVQLVASTKTIEREPTSVEIGRAHV